MPSVLEADQPNLPASYQAEERKLVRKVDWILMPILTVTLGLQYYDKAVLGSAAVFGILEDLVSFIGARASQANIVKDLSETVNGVTYLTRYSTATAAFYYGYIVAVLPFALLFSRLPLAKTAGVIVMIWGVVCLLTVTCHNYPGFVAQRVALGLMESAVSPAFVAITALWYKPSEQAVRLGIWYSATGIFSMFSGLVNFGLGRAPIASPWKALYYFCGSWTILWGFVVFFLLPESPLNPGRFFNEREKEILVRRFEQNPYGRDKQPLKLDQVKETFRDVRTYIYFLMSTAIYICNGAITAFGARIINGLGFSPLTTVALLIPGGAVTCITIYAFTYPVSRVKDVRTLLLPLSCVPVIIGAITIWTAPLHPVAGPLIGYYLVASFGAPYVLLLSLASANVAGSTKKALTNGAVFIGYNVGNIVAAYTVLAQEKPKRYRTTWIVVIVAMIITCLGSIVLRVLYVRENKRREAFRKTTFHTGNSTLQPAQDHGSEKIADVEATEGAISEGGVVEKLQDYRNLTDKQRTGFRYVY